MKKSQKRKDGGIVSFYEQGIDPLPRLREDKWEEDKSILIEVSRRQKTSETIALAKMRDNQATNLPMLEEKYLRKLQKFGRSIWLTNQETAIIAKALFRISKIRQEQTRKTVTSGNLGENLKKFLRDISNKKRREILFS